MRILLSDHFNYKKLLRFTLPSMITLVFTSIYGVVDGFFVSNYVGKTPFTAVNFIMPFLMMLGCVGFMFGTGGGALIAMTLGQGKEEKARSLFSLIVYVSGILGIVLAVLGLILLRPLATLLGAEGQLLEDSLTYGRIILLAIPAYILQYEFQCLFATAEKSTLGLYVTIAAGCTNIVLDALFVAVLRWGLPGAAAATALSQLVGGVIPLIYFARPNNSLLRLGRTRFDGRALVKVCTNGSSELLNNISMSLVNMLYNLQLLKYIGEDGVAAYGVLMYVSLVFQAVFIGYSVGTAPIIGYHYGAQNALELKGLLKKSMVLLGAFAAAMFGASYLLARPLSYVFTGYDEGLLTLTVRAFSLFAFSFLFSGYVIFGSSFFTALNNGLVSAVISFLRTMVFQVSAVLIFPLIWKVDGIWLSMVAAEVLALGVTVIFLRVEKKRYGY
ncbi:MAG: MATE family efflux transporter [Lachnospiraceae bacterium]|jgi:putative MATE family efflux protein|uniref:MATE family efflux transporter n=1 Tax=Candidatus Merdisoma sp. JLR.KK006 TaxID=3112626 RepID=UPI002FF0B898|nr:MATE family efflux transporter [Lachnospiraceae bacterium]